MGEMEKHSSFPQRKKGRKRSKDDLSKGEFMFEVCELELGEVETMKETENSTCTRHIVLAGRQKVEWWLWKLGQQGTWS